MTPPWYRLILRSMRSRLPVLTTGSGRAAATIDQTRIEAELSSVMGALPHERHRDPHRFWVVAVIFGAAASGCRC